MKISRANYPYLAFGISIIAMALILLLVMIAQAFACGGEEPPPFILPFTAPTLHGGNHENLSI